MSRTGVCGALAAVLFITGSSSFATGICGGDSGKQRLGSDVEAAYQSALRILIDLNEGKLVGLAEREVGERKVVELLSYASHRSCAKAQVELAHIKLSQAATIETCEKSTSIGCAETAKATPSDIARYETEAFELLEQSAKQGEGYFELGLMLLTSTSPYYSKEKGWEFIRRAKENGDERATTFMKDAPDRP